MNAVGVRDADESVVVRYAGEEPPPALAAATDLTVEAGALGRPDDGKLNGADCVVAPDDDGLTDAVTAALEHAPPVPVAVLTDGAAPAGDAADRGLVEAVRTADDGPDPETLSRRVRRLVAHARAAALAERAVAALETAHDAIAVADPDGDVVVVNRSFATVFGYEQSELLGRPWRTLYTDGAVDRLESAAFDTVRDGWRWTGSCEGRLADGRTAEVQTTVAGLADGSLVFMILDDPDGEGDPAAL